MKTKSFTFILILLLAGCGVDEEVHHIALEKTITLKSELESTRSEWEASKKKIALLVKTSEDKIKKLSNDLSLKTEQIDKLSENMFAKEAKIGDLSAKITTKDKQVTDFSETISTLNGQIGELSAKKDEALQEVAGLKQLSQGLEREKAHLIASDEFSKMEIKEKEQKIKELTKKISNNDLQNNDLIAKLSTMSAQIEDLSAKKEEALQKIAGLKQVSHGLERERAHLIASDEFSVKELKEKEKEITELAKTIGDKGWKNRNLMAKLSSMNDQMADLSAQKDEALQKVAGLKQLSQGLERERTHLIASDKISIKELKEKEKAISELEKSIEDNKWNNMNLMAKLSSKDAQMEELAANKNEALQKVAGLKQLSQGLERERAHLIASDEISIKELKEKEKEISKLEKSIEDNKWNNMNLIAKLSSKDAQMGELAEKKNEALQKVAGLEQVSQGLERERAHLIASDEISIKELKEKEKAISELAKSIEDNKWKNRNLMAKLSSKNAQIEELSARGDEVLQMLAGLKQISAGLQKERTYLVSLDQISFEKEKENNRKIAQLADMIHDKNKDIYDLSSLILAKNARVNSLTAKKGKILQEIAGLKQIFSGLEKERSYLVASDEISAKIEKENNIKIAKLTNDLLAKEREIENLLSKRKKNSQKVEVLGKITTKNQKKADEISAKKKKESAKRQEIYENLLKKLNNEIEKGYIKVSHEKDQIMVTIIANVLFGSGKAKIKQSGLEVLSAVGDIFKEVGEKLIQVKGHSDNMPIGASLKNIFPSNWELSVARATNVARYLQEEVEIPPEIISATGYSEYQPITSNDTPEGRTQNRRIEIVLLPLNT